MVRSRFTKFLTASLFVMASSTFSLASLDLSEGTMSIGARTGGLVSSQVNHSKGAGISWQHSDIGNGNVDSVFMVDGNFSFDYFILDQFAVGFRFHGGFPITTKASERHSNVNVGVNLEYFFDTNSIIWPYVGAGTGTGWTWLPKSTSSDWSWDASAEAGVLLGLNKNVALDLGVKADFSWVLQSKATKTVMDAQLGYFGVRAFF